MMNDDDGKFRLSTQRKSGRRFWESHSRSVEDCYLAIELIAPIERLSNNDILLPAQNVIAALDCDDFEIDRRDTESRQLRAFLCGGVLRSAKEMIQEFDRPFQDTLREITERQLEANRQAIRQANRLFRNQYGIVCKGCGKKTQAVHPILEVLCCKKCRTENDKYRVVYRTTAIKEFGIAPSELDDIRCAEVTNPNYKSGPPARLYLVAEIMGQL